MLAKINVESTCTVDFHVEPADVHHLLSSTALEHPRALAVRELHANRACKNASDMWFYSEDYAQDAVVNKHSRMQWRWRTKQHQDHRLKEEDAQYYTETEQHTIANGGTAKAADARKNTHGDHEVGLVRCDGMACVPPFWAWWSVVRAQCKLEWIGQRAQRVADRAPWDSGAEWDDTRQRVTMTIDDTYLMQHNTGTTAHVWHCRMYPRVYTPLSLQCNAEMVKPIELSAEEDQTNDVDRRDYRVNNVQQQCVLNVHVGRGVHLLLYVISTALAIAACGAYLCCMWACISCCNCRERCVHWLPCLRESHWSRRHHRAIRDSGPDGTSQVHARAPHHGPIDSAWERPAAKPAGFGSTFTRLARMGAAPVGATRGGGTLAV